jgi:Kef-type K+ transport system membrane component KefB
MAAIRELTERATSGATATALALGFALIGASVAGDLLRRFNLPRLTGYLLFGMAVGPSFGNLITESMAGHLQVVTGVATTLIALIAGLALSVERLGGQLAAIARTTAVTVTVAVAGVSLVAWLAWPWLPVAPLAVGSQRLAMLALLSVMVVSFSPTMTAAVVADS